ncbi:hypothetical protein EVAR_91450_1 [Eumeta japonica]|uniref:Uncharacterized protein n=1 Tax=Eumeta variegata TaxID=151549 RepID=A0A4C1WZ93_EUMVA|nr:hypothetical protein EVAR_91450_1 [Eumeta japonica]
MTDRSELKCRNKNRKRERDQDRDQNGNILTLNTGPDSEESDSEVGQISIENRIGIVIEKVHKLQGVQCTSRGQPLRPGDTSTFKAGGIKI